MSTTYDISKLSQITYSNFEISLVVFMPNNTTNHAITYTAIILKFFLIVGDFFRSAVSCRLGDSTGSAFA